MENVRKSDSVAPATTVITTISINRLVSLRLKKVLPKNRRTLDFDDALVIGVLTALMPALSRAHPTLLRG